MAARTHEFDLAGLRLAPGEGRRLELEVPIEPLELGSEVYTAEPPQVPVELTISIGGIVESYRLGEKRPPLLAAGKPRASRTVSASSKEGVATCFR